MTQVKGAQGKRIESAWRKRARGRTLAARRANEEARLAQFFELNEQMALTDLAEVKQRLHELHHRLNAREGRRVTQYEIAEALNVPHRTFQSWEGGKVETEGENYDLMAAFYSERLGEPITRNWILFGSDEEPPLCEAGPSEGGATGERLERVEQMLEEVAAQQTELLAAVGEIQQTLQGRPHSQRRDTGGPVSSGGQQQRGAQPSQ